MVGANLPPPPSRIGLIRKNLILLVSSVRLVLSALPLRIRSPRFREVSGIGTLITVITIVLPIVVFIQSKMELEYVSILL